MRQIARRQVGSMTYRKMMAMAPIISICPHQCRQNKSADAAVYVKTDSAENSAFAPHYRLAKPLQTGLEPHSSLMHIPVRSHGAIFKIPPESYSGRFLLLAQAKTHRREVMTHRKCCKLLKHSKPKTKILKSKHFPKKPGTLTCKVSAKGSSFRLRLGAISSNLVFRTVVNVFWTKGQRFEPSLKPTDMSLARNRIKAA